MYEKILVPVDGSDTSRQGLAEAIKLARLCGAKLRLLHIIDLLSFSIAASADAGLSAEVLDALKQGGQKVLADAAAQAQAAGVAAETRLEEGLVGRVCDVVVEEATSWGAGLIVLGTHGRRGMGRMLLGSDAEQILRQAPVPVLVVRAPEAKG
jgi:nucleotide-binding universal stress UspA family protein